MDCKMVTEAILVAAEKRHFTVTKLKLLKLLYYVQGYHYAATGIPAFPEKIFAWKHGPVVREIYAYYKTDYSDLAPTLGIDLSEVLPSSVLKIVDFVVSKFGAMSAWGLVSKTHSETPWLNHVVALPDMADGNEITKEEMMAFFSGELAKSSDNQLAALLDRAEASFGAKTIRLPDEVESDEDFVAWVRGL